MFGFIAGSIATIAFFGYMKRRHLGYRRGGWGASGCGSSMAPWERRGFGPRARWLDGLLHHLDLTPEQGKVVRKEASEFVDELKHLKGEMRGARSDIARAFRAQSFDETVMGESFARQDEAIRRVRELLVGSLARVHDVLEPHQREQLANLFDRGPGASFRPYRDWS